MKIEAFCRVVAPKVLLKCERKHDVVRHKLVSWSLTSLFSTNMAISETRFVTKTCHAVKTRLWQIEWATNVYHDFLFITAVLQLKLLDKRRLKMRDWKMRDVQKCRGGNCRAGKCGTSMPGWKMRDNRVQKACLPIKVPKLTLECKKWHWFVIIRHCHE